MKRNLLIFSFERAYEIRKIVFYRSLISYLVPELQTFEDTKIKAKSTDTKKGNQLKSIKIDQICDVTYIACRFDK